ncbi:MAG: chromosomal replication initiator protein DnaA, partial [Paludibacteraceae bacterium]|nr:chromosomal replication initiator protein DnaA [Paludibacteraceae bacterium]
MTISELSKLWQKCAHLLREQLTPSVYNTWFASLDAVSYEDKVLVLRVKSQFVAEYIEENYIRELGRAIRSVFGDDTRLAYRVLVDSTTGSSATYASQQAERPQVRFASESTDAVIWDSQLNQQYTFTTFILGKTNKLARAAGLAIAKEPGRTVFNPLFIYGGSGVGKTHLANAIGNEIAKLFPLHRVLYVSANTFKLQYQEAVREKKVPEFLVFYQNVDVLIMDDIQFFEGLKGTQDTFFHIFDYLHQSQKQLILTSDRPPLELQDVEERLLTRFKWGLSVEIERPDLNLRKAILMDKVQRDGLPLTEEIVDYIAVRACDNIRDIEGILASLMAYATLTECDIDLHLVQ